MLFSSSLTTPEDLKDTCVNTPVFGSSLSKPELSVPTHIFLAWSIKRLFSQLLYKPLPFFLLCPSPVPSQARHLMVVNRLAWGSNLLSPLTVDIQKLPSSSTRIALIESQQRLLLLRGSCCKTFI